MRITCDTSALQAQLNELSQQVRYKLKRMVTLFSYEVTLAASQNTPVGDQEAIDEQRPGYYDFYVYRNETRGIEINPGFHAGAWKYSDDASIDFDPTIYPEEQATEAVKSDIRSRYRLGQTYYIGASGPAFPMLEAGVSLQAPDGIIKPTMAQIESLYSHRLADYYKGQ